MSQKRHSAAKSARGLPGENAEDGIFTIEQNGRFTYMNKKGRELLGYAREELVGRNFVTVIAPEYREATVENFRKRQTGEAVD
ncbi:MAG: PAS domain S-box protein [Methanophagales archaeon]|nr:PAS domain S-box protein [Methanophagales archaeon]